MQKPWGWTGGKLPRFHAPLCCVCVCVCVCVCSPAHENKGELGHGGFHSKRPVSRAEALPLPRPPGQWTSISQHFCANRSQM